MKHGEWIISEVVCWTKQGYKFMATRENFSKQFGYEYVYGYTLEEVISKI